MRQRFLTCLILTVTFFALACSVAWAKPKAVTFDDVCGLALDEIEQFYPVASSGMGLRLHDRRFADYSSSTVATAVKRMTNLRAQLNAIPESGMTAFQKLNRKLVVSNLEVALVDLRDIQWHKRSPQLYVDEAVNGIYYLLLNSRIPPIERLVSVLSRFRAVPGLFSTAKKNLRSAPKLLTDLAIENLESGSSFFQDASVDLIRQFPDRSNEISRVSMNARDAMTDFVAFLRKLPAAPDSSLGIGKTLYDYKLRHEYFLPYGSDSLLKLGEAALAEADITYREYREHMDTRYQRGLDSVYIPEKFSRQDVLNYYDWEVSQVRTYLELNDIVTVPDDIADVACVQTPVFLRGMVAGIAYQSPGAFDTLGTGLFYVRPIPDSLDRIQLDARYRYVHRRGFRGSVVHEAYPGHHLQMEIAKRASDRVRQWQTNTLMIEGWALYCEQMMYEEGLFGDEDPAQWLAILGGIRFRAARIIADVKLHTGQFTYDSAVAWMISSLEAQTDLEKDYLRKEVRNIAVYPTIRMCYLTGKEEIMALREAMETRDGENFSLRTFHDNLLANGSIPPTLLWDVLGLSRP
jgi:uncharacterized protein (DUF885 family)